LEELDRQDFTLKSQYFDQALGSSQGIEFPHRKKVGLIPSHQRWNGSIAFY
jgi:hypothetical protein